MGSPDPADRLMDALVRSTFEVTAVLTRIGGENDLSLTQLRVLGILRDRRAGVSGLAAHLGVDKSSMSGLVDRAERRGLLRRERNPHDGRGVDVLLTTDGQALVERLFGEVRTAMTPSLSHLSRDERSSLAGLLESAFAPTAD
jgi:DNA-binding MarR family transcriptional regulator